MDNVDTLDLCLLAVCSVIPVLPDRQDMKGGSPRCTRSQFSRGLEPEKKRRDGLTAKVTVWTANLCLIRVSVRYTVWEELSPVGTLSFHAN
jgi:hypothetical protein